MVHVTWTVAIVIHPQNLTNFVSFRHTKLLGIISMTADFTSA